MLGSGIADHVTGLTYVFLATFSAWYLISYLTSPLRRFPGPFLARWTNLWRMFQVRQGKYHLVIQDLHKKYGPVTEFYHGSSAKNDGKIIYNLFSECTPEIHAQQKRPISMHYSLKGILSLESHIDVMIEYFCQRLEENFIDAPNHTQICDIGEWIAFYTWDVVGQVLFSQPIGYLEKGCDFNHALRTADISMDYFSLVGQMPILDHLLDKNPIYRLGPPSFGPITNISIQHLIDRLQNNNTENYDPKKPDFLDKFIETKEKYPEVVDDTQIVSYLMFNLIAGADTTGITLIAALYFSLKHPHVWDRLRSEIATETSKGAPTAVSYKDAREYPYLNAIVREAMRCHPAVAMLLERYVPKGGLDLPNGHHIPAGSVVGLNPYVVARNKSVWGEDADVFRPERWLRDEKLETEEEFEQRLRLMNNADLSFGGGSRICIGKHLGLLEVYKVIATLVSRYNIDLVDPKEEWKTQNSFFVRQSGIKVRLSRRQ
ncbi:unnamed protein product [Penicillium olsonii]|nr:unnamed protein product [Penicillium olsonii]